MQTVDDYLKKGGKVEMLSHADSGMDADSGMSKKSLERYGCKHGNRLKVRLKTKPAIINEGKL